MSTEYDAKPWLNSYPDWFSMSRPEPPETVLTKFKRVLASDPDSPCIHYFDATFSYEQIENMASAIAFHLGETGIGRQDRVMLVLQNIAQTVIASLAAWMRGAIVVPVNPMYTAREIDHLLTDSGAKIIICEDTLFEKAIKPICGSLPVITTSALDLLPGSEKRPKQLEGLRKLVFEETSDFMALIEQAGNRKPEEAPPQAGDLAYLVYTSGTTGPPKGAMVSHANIDYTCHVYEAACRLNKSDGVLGAAPLFHITGIVAHEAIAFHLGIPVVLHNRFDPEDVLRLIEKYRLTFTVAPITAYIALQDHPNRNNYDVTHFQKAYSGGAPVAPGTVKKIQETMGLKIYNVYGLTESTSPATITPLEEQGPVDEESGALSVGLVIPGLEAWIADVNDPDTFVPPGQEGELVLRGPSIVAGYWEKPEETAKAIRNGMFYTGDVAKIDEQGWCYIVDRKKDLINVSGYKVWPRDVEDVLYQHPGVKEAAVVGISDEYRGETVKAFVSPNEEYADQLTAEELIGFCKERMAAYKYPRQVEIINQLPKTPSGKILRRQLRSQDSGGV
ncbi:MAG: AMP-binding protein [Desulfobacteraceae bacterium]|nr:AMP-binding protein [Desulfobacteraceae bacterium]